VSDFFDSGSLEQLLSHMASKLMSGKRFGVPKKGLNLDKRIFNRVKDFEIG
jgi:hypothetical protein